MMPDRQPERRTTSIPDEMVDAAMQAWADLSDAPVAIDAEENHRDMATILAAALESAGIKRVRRRAVNNVWGPGDYYTTIDGTQVDHQGIRPDQYGERWESRWEPATELPEGDAS